MSSDYTTFDPRRRVCGTSTGDIEIRAAVFSRPAAPDDPLTERTRRIWSAGDYDRISVGFRHEAEAFVKRLGLARGDRVLDAACGTGNLTIPAARTGALVTGFDLVAALLEVAQAWATREALDINFDEGTVEELPYVDSQFDTVLSMFGVMFAARPDRVISELARVTRPGGRVVLANWVREGFIGRLLATHAAYVPPPAGVPSPLLWGDEATVRERFCEQCWQVTTTRRMLTFRYPHSPATTSELFRTAYGPTVRTLEALDGEGRALLAADLAGHWARNQAPGAKGTEVDAEYLEVVATRR